MNMGRLQTLNQLVFGIEACGQVSKDDGVLRLSGMWKFFKLSVGP